MTNCPQRAEMTEDLWYFFNISLCHFFFITPLALDFSLPGHYESKLLVSRQTGDQWLQVLSKGQDNDDENVPCPTAQVLAESGFQPGTSCLRVHGPIHSQRRPNNFESGWASPHFCFFLISRFFSSLHLRVWVGSPPT